MPDREAEAFIRLEPASKEGRRAQRLWSGKRLQRRYHHAWVLMDRIHDAADSAEILFRHLRRDHPDINAWFVLEEDTSDWKRLKSEGYGDRLVAHGSMQWRLLMANAQHLHLLPRRRAIMQPPGISRVRRAAVAVPPSSNHGVIKDDLSRWLNRKPIETFVTSTSRSAPRSPATRRTCSAHVR